MLTKATASAPKITPTATPSTWAGHRSTLCFAGARKRDPERRPRPDVQRPQHARSERQPQRPATGCLCMIVDERRDSFVIVAAVVHIANPSEPVAQAGAGPGLNITPGTEPTISAAAHPEHEPRSDGQRTSQPIAR